MKSFFLRTIFLFSFVFLFTASTPPDEGMFPLSEISKIGLNKAGLKIDIKEIYNPNGISFVDALVRVGGCTGSFVSEDGLILTNHHCAFDFISDASTLENNYLENGFLAENKEKEISAKGLTSMITESYEDVSELILEAAAGAKDISERTKAIQKKSRELINEAEKNDPSIRAEVSEMFVGKTYILFKYKTIRDIRIVYAPPRSVGEFGGETDNWIWPRHTGDFTFLRAYVAPDGTSRTYHEENVPFKPKKFLKVNPNGINEGDFVFLLGYPGRTFRHQPSQFIRFDEEIQLAYISELFRSLINSFDEVSERDPELGLKLSSRIKTLANTEKNFRGKLQGMERLSLVEQRETQEKQLQQFIESDPVLKEKYGNVLYDIQKIYDEIFLLGRTNLFYSQVFRQITSFALADILIDFPIENAKPDVERKTLFTEKNQKMLQDRILNLFENYNKEIEKISASKIIGDAVEFPELKEFLPLKKFNSSKSEAENFLVDIINRTKINDHETFLSLLYKSEEEIKNLNDPLVEFVREMKEAFKPIQKSNEIRSGRLNILQAQFFEVKKEWQNKTFIPDANSTLRLTFGYVRGYSPADATYFKPISTATGILEKNFTGEDDYKLLPKVRDAIKKRNFGKFKCKDLKDLPVAFLYNMDTTGGNSGSPVINAYGEVVGVNFDRAFEATINDYAWSESYSRSIGVDIRYILWVTKEIGGGDYILKELGVKD